MDENCHMVILQHRPSVMSLDFYLVLIKLGCEFVGRWPRWVERYLFFLDNGMSFDFYKCIISIILFFRIYHNILGFCSVVTDSWKENVAYQVPDCTLLICSDGSLLEFSSFGLLSVWIIKERAICIVLAYWSVSFISWFA